MVFDSTATKGDAMIDESKMTLARDWRGQAAIDGWLASEKLNGCRAYFDGRQFWTRSGNIIAAPEWFVRGLPAMHLDGEINCGRDGKRGKASFAVASNAVRLGGNWFNEVSPITATPLRFSVFDAPEVPGTWRQRMAEARRAVKKCACAVAVEFQKIRMAGPGAKLRADEMHLSAYCIPLAKLACEGFMFRSPDAIGYEQGRTEHLLRWKFTEN
jgi:DNA ligase-1